MKIKIKTDFILIFNLHGLGYNNKPTDFKINDRVIVTNHIDDNLTLDDLCKPGMIGTIDNINHRYVGRDAEHYEYWIRIGNNRTRYQLYNILKYDDVMEYMSAQKCNV